MKRYGTWKGTPREQIPWHPTVDMAKCVGCRKCFEFCSHGVYGWDDATNTPKVAEPFQCVVGCSNCSHQCEEEAIAFPPPFDPDGVYEKHMIRTMINAGVCGFHTTVAARSDDMQMVTLELDSECEKIRALAEALNVTIDAYQEISDGSDGIVMSAARAQLKGCCAGCVVPSGIFKSVQVAGGVALPAPISIMIERSE